jgi:hypothetical protein
MADLIVGTIIGGALGGLIWIIFIKILNNPFEKFSHYLHMRGWPEWKISLCGYPIMLLLFYYYIGAIIHIMEFLGF